MWKYRDHGVFSGWNGAVLVIALFTGLITGFVTVVTGMDPDVAHPAFVKILPFVLPVAVIVAGWLIFRRHTHDDDAYKKDPVTPEWQKLAGNDEIPTQMCEERKAWCVVWLVLTPIPLFGVFLEMVKFPPEHRWEWILLGCILGAVVLFHLVNFLRWRFWRHPPESMEYTSIDVAYCNEQPYLSKGGTRKCIKLFFFLPKGRYRVILNGVSIHRTPPDVIYFVCWHGMVWWVHWND